MVIWLSAMLNFFQLYITSYCQVQGAHQVLKMNLKTVILSMNIFSWSKFVQFLADFGKRIRNNRLANFPSVVLLLIPLSSEKSWIRVCISLSCCKIFLWVFVVIVILLRFLHVPHMSSCTLTLQTSLHKKGSFFLLILLIPSPEVVGISISCTRFCT